MEPSDCISSQFLGLPCGQHGPYTFFKSMKYVHKDKIKKLTLGEFFYVNISPNATLCIGELQLLWYDKHHPEEQLSSVRLYFRPEDTPQGRKSHHGQDELLAEAEKVVVRVPDLLKWIVEDHVTWTYGSEAFTHGKTLEDNDFSSLVYMFATNNCALSQPGSPSTEHPPAHPGPPTDNKVKLSEEVYDRDGSNSTAAIILSYSQYCRYRSVLKRLQNCTNTWLKNALVSAIGGFTVQNPDSRIMFCRDTCEHPSLEDHDFRKDHLAPLLKGRKRKKLSFKKDSESDTNDSEASGIEKNYLASVTENSDFNSNQQTEKPSVAAKLTNTTKSEQGTETRSASKQESCRVQVLRPGDSGECPPQEADFLRALFSYMNQHSRPIDRLPTLGFREVDLYVFFNLVQKRGGHTKVTQNRLWKHIYDLLGGNPANTSAATCTRRLYEKLLLPYERYLESEEKLEDKKNGRKPTEKSKSVSMETSDDHMTTTKSHRVKQTVQEILNHQRRTKQEDTEEHRSTVKQEDTTKHHGANKPEDGAEKVQENTKPTSKVNEPKVIKEENEKSPTVETKESPSPGFNLRGNVPAPPNYVVVSSPSPVSTVNNSFPWPSGAKQYHNFNHMQTPPPVGVASGRTESRLYSKPDLLAPYSRPSVIHQLPNGATSKHAVTPDSNSHKRPHSLLSDIKSKSAEKSGKNTEFSPSNPKHSRLSTGNIALTKTPDYIDQLRQARRMRQEQEQACAPLDLSLKSRRSFSPTSDSPDTPINLSKNSHHSSRTVTNHTPQFPANRKPPSQYQSSRTPKLPTNHTAQFSTNQTSQFPANYHTPKVEKPHKSMTLPVTVNGSSRASNNAGSRASHNVPSRDQGRAMEWSASESGRHGDVKRSSSSHQPSLPAFFPPQSAAGVSSAVSLPAVSAIPAVPSATAAMLHPAFPGFPAAGGLLPSPIAPQLLYPLMAAGAKADQMAQFLYNPPTPGAFVLPTLPIYNPSNPLPSAQSSTNH